MPPDVGSPLWNRLFGSSKPEHVEHEEKASERHAQIVDLVGRPGFQSEIIAWLDAALKTCRVIPGKESDMNYRCGMRDGIEMVRDRMTALQHEARGNYDER